MEVHERVKASTLKPEVDFCRQGGIFRISFSGYISAADQAIFTKFGVSIDNGSPKCAEWSKETLSSKDPIWRTSFGAIKAIDLSFCVYDSA